MGMQQQFRLPIEKVSVSMFAELYHCPQILTAHYKQLKCNDVTIVGRFEDGHRRVGYLSPWDCPSKRLKKLVPYDMLLIVEEQELQLVKGDDGTVTEMLLTTRPTVESVPFIGSIGMGCVTIHISSVPGLDGCEMHMTLDCDAKGLGWLRPLKHFVEECMLMNTLRVALHCVDFIADVARGGPSAAALCDVLDKVEPSTEVVTPRSPGLSRTSITSAASLYFDALESLLDDPIDIKTGADGTETQESGIQQGPSFNVNAIAGTAAHKAAAARGQEAEKERKAGQPQPQRSAPAPPATKKTFLGKVTSRVLRGPKISPTDDKAAAAQKQAAKPAQGRQAEKQRKGGQAQPQPSALAPPATKKTVLGKVTSSIQRGPRFDISATAGAPAPPAPKKTFLGKMKGALTSCFAPKTGSTLL